MATDDVNVPVEGTPNAPSIIASTDPAGTTVAAAAGNLIVRTAKTTTKIAAPLGVKVAFWGTLLYVGPVAAFSTLGPVGLIVSAAVVHFVVPEIIKAI